MDQAQRPDLKPQVSVLAVIGMMLLMWSASVYSAFGLSAYPRQEWLLESLVAIIFIMPVFHLLKGPGSLAAAVRIVGIMLLVHSAWDALHWPGHSVIDTPIDPRFPRVCPFLDLPVGFALLIRGR